MNTYQFERVIARMKQKYGAISMDEADDYFIYLFPMESNLFRIHAQIPEADCRRLREAFSLVLYDIEDRIEGKSTDTEAFRNKLNKALEHALLEAFDPFTSEEVKEQVLKTYDVQSLDELTQEQLKDYYTVPIQCLELIADSQNYWCKKIGPNGYFDFLRNAIGAIVSPEVLNVAQLRADPKWTDVLEGR